MKIRCFLLLAFCLFALPIAADGRVSGAICVITDVIVMDMKAALPDDYWDYTGVSTEEVTGPYVPGVGGNRITGVDVNYKIGGYSVAIYVKYESIDINDPKNNDLKVLTNIAAAHWPDWKPMTPDGKPCPNDGWERANGIIGGVKGALSKRTKNACWRIGLVVKYTPFKNAAAFITNLFLSKTPNTAPVYPKYASANRGIWPMIPGKLDIHRKCGDDWAFYLCTASGKKAPPLIDDVPDSMKLQYIQQFAPYVYMNKDERYYPSTVEFSFPHLTRFLNTDDGNYWLQTKEKLPEPSSILPYFHGDLEHAKAYAFWVDKKLHKEITYFFYFPYNRGKEFFNTIWGNHVGDWEHVTVRLGWNYSKGQWVLTPFEMYLSEHSKGDTRQWEKISKVNGKPVVYCAWGSHAMYFDDGNHKYKYIPFIGSLIDHCSKGKIFDVFNNKFEAYDFTGKKGLANNPWPTWMSTDYKNPGKDPSDPSSGAIYRWGNKKRGCDDPFGGTCRLENGPTGPIEKRDVWDPDKIEK